MLLPDAYVIGRVFIADESWIVARPISSAGSKSWAIRGDRWEDILEDSHGFAKYEEVLLNITEESAEAHTRINEKRNLIVVKQTEIKQRESATDEEHLEQFGSMTCGHPGCYFKAENRPPGVADPEREARIRELQQEIGQINREIKEIEPEQERVAQALETAKVDFFAARREQRRNIRSATSHRRSSTS